MQHQTTNHVWKSSPNNPEYNMDILLFASLNVAHRMIKTACESRGHPDFGWSQGTV